MRRALLSLLAWGLGCNWAMSQETKFSGPQPGEKITPFKVLKFADADTVQVARLIQPQETGTTLVCFLHKVTEPAIHLLIHLDVYASKQSGLKRHYVLLTADRAQAEKMVRGWTRSSALGRLGVNISVDGPEGPGAYGLNRNVTMTALIAKDHRVVKSFALLDPNFRDTEQILTSVAKSLGQPSPSFEAIQSAVLAERRQRRARTRAQAPIVKLAPNPELGAIMYNMIRTEGNRAENARRRSEELLKWAKDNRERQLAIKTYCKAILQGEFEMGEYSRAAIKKLAHLDQSGR